MKRKSLLLLALIGVLCFCSWSYADELTAIREAISEQGAKWEAGETSISVLSPQERRMRLGDLQSVPTGTEKVISAPKDKDKELPTSLDWRNNGGNWVTPVRNQGHCGSCWAFGTVAGLESNVLIAKNTPGINLDLSEQVLVSCNDNDAGSCSGGSKLLASDYLQNVGVPLEKCYRYTQTDGTCSKACANWQNCTYKVGSWSKVTEAIADMKSALYTYGPLPVSMYVYSDFYYYKKGVYSKTPGATYEGGHAILIVGYDDANQCFIVKNSWGGGWGEKGFFRIAYTELAGDVYFGRDTLAYTAPPLLTVQVEGDGKGEVVADCLSCKKNLCSSFYTSGTDVTITAVAAKNMVFTGWSGCTASSEEICNVTMNGNISVTATFLKPPKMTVTPGALSFGNVAVGVTSDAKPITIKNMGSADLVISSVVISGTNASDFSFSGDCGEIGKGATCTAMEVTFSPASKGPKKAYMDLYYSAPALTKKRVNLSGKGI